MNKNLAIYESVKSVPDHAKKTIIGGRLKGMTDINPMWRIKVLTETFGPVGIGWKYELVKSWLELGAGGEVAAFVEINLYYFDKESDKWSAAIPGMGGSKFITVEKSGPYTSDECYKMAMTDALSVACKALGVGADVYWGDDATKYTQPEPVVDHKLNQKQLDRLVALMPTETEKDIVAKVRNEFGYTSIKDIKQSEYDKFVDAVSKAIVEGAK